MVSSANRPDKHSSCNIETYFATHETIMGRFRSAHHIGADTLEFIGDGQKQIVIAGEIACAGNIVIQVFKILHIIEGSTVDPLVQTERYAYNVSVRGLGNIFRYDNQHPESPHPGHWDEHHKHVYPWPPQVGSVSDQPVWIGADKWPTLGDVIQEVVDWRAKNTPEEFGFVNALQSAEEIAGRFGTP